MGAIRSAVLAVASSRRALPLMGLTIGGALGGLAGRERTAAQPATEATPASEEERTMEPRITHLSPEGMHANPAYSQAVSVAGNVKTIYVGGQNAVTADGQVVGAGDLAAQSEQAFANLETVLAAAGATIRDVVKWTVFVIQGQDLQAGFAVFQRRYGTIPNPPAITFAYVAGLANPDFLVEIEAIAVVPAGTPSA